MPNQTITKTITHLMNEALAAKVFPGGALLVSKGESVLFCDTFGVSDINTREKVEIDTIFDLASLTKPLATTLAVMKLVQDGKANLEDTVSDICLKFRKTDKKDIQLKHLLSHTSGLADYVPYYKQIRGNTGSERKRKLRDLLLQAPLKYLPGRTVLYSDLGFMILNWMVEQIAQKPLDLLVAEDIYGPMGINSAKGLFFIDLALNSKPAKYAATEYCPWRNMLIKGQVHDENAYMAGGVDGQAGLFGDILTTHELLSKLLTGFQGDNSKPPIRSETLHLFLTEQENFRRTLGFDMPSFKDSSAGKYFSKNSVGHLGFTGTSFWIDLDRSIIILLLTNRIHPSRENTKIKSFRPLLHDAVMKLII